MQKNKEQRLIDIGKLRILYPELEEIKQLLRDCHTRAHRRREPPCALVTGYQGVGKTTLYEYYADDYPRVETNDGTLVPCLTASIPVPATVKGLVTALLEALGDADPGKGNIVTQTMRLKTLLKACETEIIFLDEFQHIIDRDSERVLKTTADWLKNLINSTKISVVLLGMPNCTKILDANSQLRRRFSIRKSIEPFAWLREENGKTDYPMRKLLKLIEMKLPLEKASNLADPDMAKRIFYASGGVIDSIMKLVRGSAEFAIETGTEKITLELLARAYDLELAANQPDLPHPFKVNYKSLKELIPFEKPAEIQRMSGKQRI